MTKRSYENIHGLSRHRLYSTFLGMHIRCYNPNHSQYKDWGGRGIVVCDRWNRDIVGSYEAITNFISDMYPTFKEGLSLDRINVNGNYEPSNCRWATRQEQSDNARSVKPVLQLDKLTGDVIAEFKTLHEANRVTNIPWQGIRSCCHCKPKYNTAGGYRWKFKEAI